MKFNKKKISVGTIGLWAVFFITSTVMVALIIGGVFSSKYYWIPIIPIKLFH